MGTSGTVLWALAVAQPLLDLLGDTPEFFVARGNTRADILLLAFGLVLVPPTALWLVEQALARAPRARAATHLVFIALLAAVLAVQLVKDLAPGLAAAAAMVLALAAGAAAAFLYARHDGVRSFVTVLAPAPVLFLALFLLFSPASDLVLPQDEVSAAGARGSETPVVMLVFDELAGASLLDSRGRIDAARYPNFARLARGSTWYPNATTVDLRDRARGAGRDDRDAARGRLASDRGRPSAEPLYAARRALSLPRAGARDGALPGEPLRRACPKGRRRPPALARGRPRRGGAPPRGARRPRGGAAGCGQHLRGLRRRGRPDTGDERPAQRHPGERV